MPAPTANIKFTADNADLLAKMRQAEQQFGTVDSRVGGLSSTVNQLARAVGAYLTVQTALNLAKLGESFENARQQFGKYVSDVETGTNRLRQASKNQIDDLRLLQLANDGLRKGLPFSSIETALRFAENQADQTGESIEQVYGKLVQALAKAEAGVGRNVNVLIRYGITAKGTTDILQQMTTALALQADELDQTGDAVAQAETQWTNASIKIGQSIRQHLLPAFVGMSNLLQLLDDGSLASQLANISDRFSELRQQTGLKTGTSSNALSGQEILANLTQSALAGTFQVGQLEQALIDLQALQAEGPKRLDGAYSDVIFRLNELLAKQTTVQSNRVPYGPDESDFAEIQRLNEEEKQRQLAAQQAAAAADQLRREQLAQAREEVKIRISLGQATYADLGSLLSEQEALNKGFLARDKAAYLAWLTDRAAVYQNDKANAAKAESEKYNDYQRYVEDILVADSLTQEERYRMATEAIDFQLANENFGIERQRQLVDQKRAIESEYQQFLLQNYQQQLELLNNIFGQPALQLVDQFFASGEVRFEEFLKNILRMAARYALQAALFSIFGSILGGIPGLAGAVGGTAGGGFLGGGGILSVPTVPNLTGGLPDLSGLNYRGFPGTTGPGSSSPGFAQSAPQVTVQILATPDQLAAIVATGNHQRDRSNLSS